MPGAQNGGQPTIVVAATAVMGFLGLIHNCFLPKAQAALVGSHDNSTPQKGINQILLQENLARSHRQGKLRQGLCSGAGS